jgi:hypothetical protein
MNPRHAAALALVGLYVLTPPLSWAQSRTEELKTFTAPDGAFSFRYWNQLIRCEKDPRGTDLWSPDENCNAYVPVCDGTVWQHQTHVACFGYPRNKITNTQAFEAATFSVEVVDESTTEKNCLSGPPKADKHGAAIIRGVSFKVFDVGDAGTGQSTDGDVYRTFHSGKCYQLGVNRATTTTVFDPPARALTDADWHKVDGTLEQARKSFQFLK